MTTIDKNLVLGCIKVFLKDTSSEWFCGGFHISYWESDDVDFWFNEDNSVSLKERFLLDLINDKDGKESKLSFVVTSINGQYLLDSIEFDNWIGFLEVR